METSTPAFTPIRQVRDISMFTKPNQRSQLLHESKTTPAISRERLQKSSTDKPIDVPALLEAPSRYTGVGDTVLYLGYGSNLSAETFRGKRKIKPLSQINVVVPSIALAFDLPGLPYAEPCFANSRWRQRPPTTEKTSSPLDYHKDHWHKGLVGVVYEVTKEDYAHIIATEGGGSGYGDVVVDCYTLSNNPKEKVPMTPTGQNFKAHTLLAPPSRDRRPDPSYAQPSARYLKLITDGAAEHNLPYEYQDFLHQIRTYQMTTTKQRLGQFIFITLWAPIFMLIFGGAAAIFLRPDGTYPAWFARFARSIFVACWNSYDNFFKPLFGDGERTLKDLSDDQTSGTVSEKAPLIRDSIERYGIGGRLETMV